MRNNGKRPINDDGRTSPWIYVPHKRGDVRGGVTFRVECPGSNKNRYMAQMSC